MANAITAPIPDVPQAAMEAFEAAASRVGANVTDVINWCLEVYGLTHRSARLHDVTTCDGRQKITLIVFDPVKGGSKTLLTVNLRAKANEALAKGCKEFGCAEAEVIARIAVLAKYFGSTELVLSLTNSYRLTGPGVDAGLDYVYRVPSR